MHSFTISEHLDHLGNSIINNIHLTEYLFKAGALMYLMFIARVLQKIWATFQNQSLAFGLGNLSLSILLSVTIRLCVPEQVRVQVDHRPRVPETVVDTCIFVGAFTCVSIIWQMVSIAGDLVTY
ncbi:hypothetical protein FB446DRAFT_714717 [Lentinula raphanica]|nr:hypothetical protein FB446DRAFT_714717 [Lentinula raphanica]